MRKREVVNLEGKEYTIKELTVNDIIELTQQSRFLNTLRSGVEEQKSSGSELELLKAEFEEVMKRCCDFTVEDIKKNNLAPSEIKKLYDVWKNVNSDFLAAVKALGLVDLLMQIKEALLSDFLKLLAI